MRSFRLILVKGFVMVVSTFLLSSCGDEPFVSRYETVEVFNSSREIASKIVYDELGYERMYEDHYANTNYNYVLYDGNVECPVISSANPEFKTESDSQNGPIHKNDRCIDCGYKWIDHERW